MATETEEAVAAFRRYTDAFQTLDPRAAAACFHEPSLISMPIGVFALADRAAAERFYTDIMKDMPGRGYVRTELAPLQGTRLGEGLVELRGGGNWINKAGEGFMAFGMTYTLRKTDGAWRIITAVVHAPDAR